MRVLIDTNVFLSYLLHPQKAGVVQKIYDAIAQELFILLLPEDLLDEIFITVANKSRLAKHIPRKELKEFIAILHQLGEIIPRIQEPIPAVTRDPKDDFLLAYALVGATDYLVTGDKDLLVLKGQVDELEIVSPAEFSKVLATLID